ILPRSFLPVVISIIGDAISQTEVKKSRQPNVFGRASSEIDVRRAQDTAAFFLTAIGKRDAEIRHSDFRVAAIKAVTDEASQYAERIQNRVGQKAHHVQRRGHQVEKRAAFRVELKVRFARRSRLDCRIGRNLLRLKRYPRVRNWLAGAD